MKVSELMIGNLIYVEKCQQIERVNYITTTSVGYGKGNFAPIDSILGYFNHIELTEEWLLKFGFNKDYKKGWIGIDVKHNNGTTTDFVLGEPFNMGEWQSFYAFIYNEYRFVELKYVHELQKLYFALTGEELEITL